MQPHNLTGRHRFQVVEFREFGSRVENKPVLGRPIQVPDAMQHCGQDQVAKHSLQRTGGQRFRYFYDLGNYWPETPTLRKRSLRSTPRTSISISNPTFRSVEIFGIGVMSLLATAPA